MNPALPLRRACTAVLLLLAAAAGAATGESRTRLNPGDPQLSVPVKVGLRRAAVPVLLQEIGAQAGVTLRAEGEAADLHVTAYGEAPARELLQRLAVLLQLSWRQTGDRARPEYTLYASEEDKLLARAAILR